MTAIILSIFLQFQTQVLNTSKPLALCADPTVFHTSVLLSICSENKNAALAYGICWSENPNPSIFDAFTIFNADSNNFEFRVKNLKPETQYYFSFFELDKSGASTYFNAFQVSTLRELKIGDYYQGGIICYLFKPKDSLLYVAGEQHGLIISKEDLGYAYWGQYGIPIADSTSIDLGQGKINSDKIRKEQGENVTSQYAPNTTNLRIIYPSAAILCHQYSSDGYSDWFLPSKGELDALYAENYNSNAMFGINPSESYWTSSEVFISFKLDKTKRKETTSNHRRAWQAQIRYQNLIIYTMVPKKSSGLVRAMRYF
jgi:hypothetical protein